MDYCIASFAKEQEEKAFRIYVTDALKSLTENTAKFAGGTNMSKRFYEIIKPRTDAPQSSSQVISRIRKKLGGEKA